MVATLFVKMTKEGGGAIKGDATEKKHLEWIVVNSVTFKLARTSEQEGGAVTRGFGKAKLDPIEFDSELGSHSMPLMLASATGHRLSEVEIHQCKASDAKNAALEPYVKWKLKHAMVQSYQVSGDSEDIPKEQWSLTYAEIECEYHEADVATGKLKKENDFKWNVSEGAMAS